MKIQKTEIKAILAVVLVLTAVSVAFGGGRQKSSNEKDEVWEKYSDIKWNFQIDLCKLFVSRWPELKELMEISRDLQLTQIERSTIKYYYLKKNAPQKIIRDKGILRLANFDMTGDYDAPIRKVNPNFVKLEQRILKLKAASKGHPLWPEIRKKHKELSKDKEYQQLMRKFKESIKDVEKLLKRQ